MTLTELRARWAIRDLRYARRKLPLSDAEKAVIRDSRLAEAGLVSDDPDTAHRIAMFNPPEGAR